MTVTSEMADSRPTEHALESHGAVLHFLGLGRIMLIERIMLTESAPSAYAALPIWWARAI